MKETSKREMNEDELAIFINLRSANKNQIDLMYEEIRKLSWVIKAIEKHCEAREIELEKSARIMLLSISEGAIGYAVKYLDIIQKWALLQNKKEISMEDFSTKIFPFGFI